MIIHSPFTAPFWEYSNTPYEHSYRKDETGEELSLIIKLPGIKKEEINLKYSSLNPMINLIVTSDGDPIINQNIYLQSPIDKDKIEASLELGVLTISAPSQKEDTDKIIQIK